MARRIHKILDCETKFYSQEGIRVVQAGKDEIAHCLALMFALEGFGADPQAYELRCSLWDENEPGQMYDNLTFVYWQIAEDMGCEVYFRVDGLGARYKTMVKVEVVSKETGAVEASLFSRALQQCTKRKSACFRRKSTTYQYEKAQRDFTKQAGLTRLRKYAPWFQTNPQLALRHLQTEPPLESMYPEFVSNMNRATIMEHPEPIICQNDVQMGPVLTPEPMEITTEELQLDDNVFVVLTTQERSFILNNIQI